MKVVILAGGFGTRISEESQYKPKPMIEIGEMPILWHIMKNYSYYGYNEFIICAGYKQHIIKEWFADYFFHTSDITFDYSDGRSIIIHNLKTEPWKVTVVNTGLKTQTGGRIKRIKEYTNNESFMMTYGDAVGNIDIPKLLQFHKQSQKIGTLTMCNFSQNKGVVEIGKNGTITAFREKSNFNGDLINCGYMVFEPSVFDYIKDDETNFEKESLNNLVRDNQLAGYVHSGFWQCMDTLREKNILEKLWESGNAPWKIWDGQ